MQQNALFLIAAVALVLGAIGQVQNFHLRQRIAGLEFDRRRLTAEQREMAEHDLDTLVRIVAGGQDAEAEAVVRQLHPDAGRRLADLDLTELADVLGEDVTVQALDVPGAAEQILRDESEGDAE